MNIIKVNSRAIWFYLEINNKNFVSRKGTKWFFVIIYSFIVQNHTLFFTVFTFCPFFTSNICLNVQTTVINNEILLRLYKLTDSHFTIVHASSALGKAITLKLPILPRRLHTSTGNSSAPIWSILDIFFSLSIINGKFSFFKIFFCIS